MPAKAGIHFLLSLLLDFNFQSIDKYYLIFLLFFFFFIIFPLLFNKILLYYHNYGYYYYCLASKPFALLCMDGIKYKDFLWQTKQLQF